MITRRRTAVGLTAAGIVGALALSQVAAYADLAPQPGDVVAVGSDIQQNAFNFLADGYHELPGYNTAGNKNRFFSFDSSGDANGRSAYLDGTSTVLNPTISLYAGAENVVRPSGGNGGVNALTRDGKFGNGVGGTSVQPHWIDIARSPNPPTSAQQSAAEANLGSRLRTVRVARDRDLIAAASTTNAPATLSGDAVVKIYEGTYTTWGQIPGYQGPGQPINIGGPAYAGPAASETIVPLYLPSSAGMQTIFNNELTAIKGSAITFKAGLTIVQQNDPSAITTLPDAQKVNAIVPFPKGRFTLLNTGYYANPATANSYSQVTARSALSAAGVQLLGAGGTTNGHSATDPFGVNFFYHAIFRESDYQSTTPWQPGSTLNWVQALFYNPGGPTPFVNTEAGKALLAAAGVVPEYDASLGTTSVG